MDRRKLKLLSSVAAIFLLLILSACSTLSSPKPVPTATLATLPTLPPTVTAEIPPTQEIQPTPTSDDPMTASINGRVWHDACTYTGVEQLETAPSGCVSDGSGGWVANGMMAAEETGIGSVYVTLGAGACPATVIKVTNSNENGFFTFPNLAAGEYCVSIDPLRTENAGLTPPLEPGQWTAPVPDQNEITLTLGAGQSYSNVDFGWDYLNYPQQTAAEETGCSNVATFLEHVTYPDNASIRGGTPFTKTWRVRNDGTCVWTPEYALVFKDGDQMGGPAATQIPLAVAPGATMDVSLNLTAPGGEGSFTGNWLLKSAEGDLFGIGPEGSQSPLSVKITISPDILWSTLGTPSWNDSFDDGDNWNQYDDGYVRNYIQNGHMTMEARQLFDTWVATYPMVDDYHMEAIFTTGPVCAGMDRYGMIVRADILPDYTKNGYQFSFTCDGQFSIRKWDGDKAKSSKLIDWTSTSAINTGPNAVNHMGITVDGDTLTIYANGIMLGRVNDSDLYDGKIGVMIAAPNTPGFLIYVDQVAYWAIDNP